MLDKDPVFRTILSRRLTYPVLNAQEGYTKLVYAQFEIDEKGHIQNVKIFNPAMGKGYYFIDFDVAVKKALNRLPPLNPRYLGKYMLPIIFTLNDMQTGKQIIPNNTDFNGRRPGSILLKSVTVIGYSHRSSANPKTNHMPGTETYNLQL